MRRRNSPLTLSRGRRATSATSTSARAAARLYCAAAMFGFRSSASCCASSSARRQQAERRRHDQPRGLLVDHPAVRGHGCRDRTLRLDPVGDRARQARIGLRHVGPRHLADLEPVARRLQLPASAGPRSDWRNRAPPWPPADRCRRSPPGAGRPARPPSAAPARPAPSARRGGCWRPSRRRCKSPDRRPARTAAS